MSKKLQCDMVCSMQPNSYEICTLLISHDILAQHKGPFTNYVYGTRQLGGPKMSTVCQRSYHRKCQLRGVSGQKKVKIPSTQFVNDPLMASFVGHFEPPSSLKLDFKSSVFVCCESQNLKIQTVSSNFMNKHMLFRLRCL